MRGIQGLSSDKATGSILSVHSKAYVPFSLGLGFVTCFNCQIVSRKAFTQSPFCTKPLSTKPALGLPGHQKLCFNSPKRVWPDQGQGLSKHSAYAYPIQLYLVGNRLALQFLSHMHVISWFKGFSKYRITEYACANQYYSQRRQHAAPIEPRSS